MKNNKYEENIFYYFASDLGSKTMISDFIKLFELSWRREYLSIQRNGKRRDRDFGRDKRFEGIIIIATAREKEGKGRDAGER